MTIKTEIQRQVSKARRSARNKRYAAKQKKLKKLQSQKRERHFEKRAEDRLNKDFLDFVRSAPSLSVKPE